jgi:hypothetical protein
MKSMLAMFALKVSIYQTVARMKCGNGACRLFSAKACCTVSNMHGIVLAAAVQACIPHCSTVTVIIAADTVLAANISVPFTVDVDSWLCWCSNSK